MQAAEDLNETIETTPAVEGIGAMLRTRRLELGLSQADVANQVKLPTRRIEAMEQERWEELPDGPYLRGFLRNVARVLNIDAAALMARVDASVLRMNRPDTLLAVSQTAPRPMLPRRSGPADDRRGGRTLVLGAVAFALVAALIAWSGTRSFDQLVTLARSTAETATRPAEPPSAPAPAPTSEAPVDGAAVDAVQAAPAPPTSAPSPEGAPVPAAGDAAIALQFRFNEESWVEVRSADGKVLVSQTYAAGSERAVDGEAPYTVVVGNARGVALRYRGQPVDLTPYTRDAVARFKLS